MKIFRDPVHGDLGLESDLEIPLMDTPEIQRMRGIKQLGTACMVYPSAVHTRFEHSLGTCHLVRTMIAHIEEAQGPIGTVEEKRAVHAAALLHDVSHIPFGHTFEDERRIFPRHDVPERFRHFLGHGALGAALKRLKLCRPASDLLTGARSVRPVFRDIISGAICADLLDYLARDAYFCGLNVAWDRRIFRYFRVGEPGSACADRLYIEAQKSGFVREDVLSEIVNLLRIRYFLSERVYFHHAKTASGAMISRAVECAVKRGLRLEDLFPLTDDRLLMRLEDIADARPSGADGEDRQDRRVIRSLLDHLLAHRIYKRAYVLSRRVGEERQRELVALYHEDRAAREDAERQLARRLRLDPGELVIYCPSAKMQLKEADVRVRIDEGPPRSLADMAVPEIRVLQEKHRDLWRFYVFVSPERVSGLARIAEVCESYFQAPNHLPALQSGQLFLGGGL